MKQNTKQTGQAVLAAVIILAVIAGVSLQAGITRGDFSFRTFRMFTTLSNLFVLAYYITANIWRRNGNTGMFCPAWRFSVIISISLTGLVAAFMLRAMFADADSTMRAALFLLHDVVPVCVVLDWLLFAEKGRFRRWFPLAGILPALCYVTVAMVGAALGHGLGMGASRYPYPFLDIDMLGVPVVAGICCALAAAVLLAGVLLMLLDGFLAKRQAQIK